MSESGQLLLGIDIGTSSTKGVLAHANGEILATSERTHSLSLPRPGWAEHDAESIWWKDFTEICAELLPQAQNLAIAALCVSGIGPCLLVADKDGKPLRPAILYGIDTRASQEIAEINERYGAETILTRGGSPLTSQAVGPKLLWLQHQEPEIWRQTRYMLMASSFIVQRLTGAYILDHHSASQCDPLYDLKNTGWIPELAQEIAPGLELPKLLWPAEVAGTITQAAAEATGLPAGLPVAAGTIDAWAEAASVGVREPGDLMIMYGSTMFFVEVLKDLRPSPQLWGTVGLFPGTQTLAAGMATSGTLTAWLRQIANDLPYETLLAEAGKVRPGSDGLVILPYFAGERTPIFDPHARGVICGLTLSHGRGHLYRALLEATGYAVRHILQAMHDAGSGGQRIVAVGGGTKGGLWTQIVSDITGRSQELPAQTIGASYGDAWLAAISVSLASKDKPWNSLAITVEPNPELKETYNKLYYIYRELYPATLQQVHALASFDS
jgi:xylulokinase